MNNETPSNTYIPLPTIYYPFVERKNWEYWYRLSNGEYVHVERATIIEALKNHCLCKRLGIPSKCRPRSSGNRLGTQIALNLFSNRLSDRSQKDPSSEFGGRS